MSIRLDTPLVKNTRDLVRRTSHVIAHPVRQALEDYFVFPRSNKAAQVLLSMQYREMLALHLPMPKFEDVEFRAYSQFGEDGILLYLFSVLGTTNKKCAEICGGGGYDNTANLIINHGWNGLFFDGSEKNIRRGQQFYARCADTKVWPPKLVQAWITADNINGLLKKQGYTGEIDLLSLDMDGVDYWVWKAIECISPRVVVLEYNNVLGPELSVTIPYNASYVKDLNNVSLLQFHGRRVVNTFVGKQIADRIDTYYGASLTAFARLSKQKGYRLVGSERFGYNAFFVRSDIGEEILSEITPAECFHHPFTQYASEVRRRTVADRAWVEV
ncbi:MAG TPA: hypothetical protein VKR83_02710 [Ktedonobacteraceae bacterium]|nr:hypothetical protein [Ktedonobacteraceae bacterium]